MENLDKTVLENVLGQNEMLEEKIVYLQIYSKNLEEALQEQQLIIQDLIEKIQISFLEGLKSTDDVFNGLNTYHQENYEELWEGKNIAIEGRKAKNLFAKFIQKAEKIENEKQ